MRKTTIFAFVLTIFMTPTTHCMNALKQALELAEQRERCNSKLVAAAQEGDLQLVQVLIPVCNVDARMEPLRLSALGQAAQNGKLPVVMALVNAEADVNIQDASGNTPLMIACTLGHSTIVDFLLRKGAQKSLKLKGEKGSTPLRQACQEGYSEILELLLPHCDNEALNLQDDGGATSLFVASINNHPECLSLLIAAKADPTIACNDGWLPLHASCETGNLLIAKQLVEANSQTVKALTKKKKTPLWIASFHSKEDVVNMLVTANADVTVSDDNGFLPLHVACQNGHIGIAAQLISQDQDSVNTPNNTGCTPLHSACGNGQANTVALLLQSKADTTIRDVRGRTAFDYAKNKPSLIALFPQEVNPSKRQSVQAPDGENSAKMEDEAEEKKSK